MILGIEMYQILADQFDMGTGTAFWLIHFIGPIDRPYYVILLIPSNKTLSLV